MKDVALKVLLVDDRPENLLALESLLKKPGVEFFRAGSGRAALELLLVHEFALALLDVQMPEMDGFELAELMRGTEQTRAVPIIFVTAGAHSKVSAFRGYEKGAVDFLYKPLDSHVVQSKVQVFLDLASQRQALRFQLDETQRVLQERDGALVETREALRTRDEFMSIASHELKTPLTSLHLQLQLMMRILRKSSHLFEANPESASLVDKLFSAIQVCERQSGKLSSLLDGLLDLTRVRLGRLELNKSEVDLAVVVREVVERFKVELDQKKLELRVQAPPRLIGHWDPVRIEQIVTNLVSNAIKYGDGKPVELRIEHDAAQDRARIVVRDQGIGIAPDMQQKVFERFERAVVASQISGLGLGLYITRQIVEGHGGSIRVESKVGAGSTFVVELPLRHESTA